MNASKQNGMVLLVSLVLLLMLTLIAITASNQATLQLRISSNSEQRTMAFQAAETGISRWTSAYFLKDSDFGGIKENLLPYTETIENTDTAFVISKQSKWGPCDGGGIGFSSGIPQMDCFDLTVEGLSACDDNNDCVKAVHRQGGLRRGDIQ